MALPLDGQIVDIDWQFGVTASCSEENQVGQTFVQVKLSKETEGVKDDINFELDVDQFYSLLHDLEKARITLKHKV